jgi:hypothetical protein
MREMRPEPLASAFPLAAAAPALALPRSPARSKWSSDAVTTTS